jgi:hypothetical protein
MTGFQSPQLLSDLYRDLRDRRLLPLVLVLAVGLAVVPMALSSKPSAPAPSPAVPLVQKSNAPSTQVVVSNPGVRDYRRRLREDTPKDPFVSPFPSAHLAVSGGQVTQTTGGSPSTVSSGAVSSASSSDTASTISSLPSGSSFGASPVTTHSDTGTNVVFYRLKLRTGQVGGTMKVQDQVGPLSSVPSQSVPALGFLGATMDSDLNPKRAYFLVSNGISLITGDAACVFGSPCQMLALKPDQYADLTWIDGLRYRVKLLKFERHVRDKPPSQLGDSSDSSSGQRDSGTD